ncbi:DEAD/DEAH box helicase [archaeon]|nr:MAG: DEAD/DEAH box helicase [archaeon]
MEVRKMSSNLVDLASEWELNANLTTTLVLKGFDDFFPVQKLVIPQLLRQNRRTCLHPQDICVSAPTGSGKTLAYAIPVLNTFLNEPDPYLFNRRLRALILLPSRELAVQVYNVFNELVQGTGIKVCLATGSRNFSKEQSLICSPDNGMTNVPTLFSTHLGYSNFDIIIATPGRLLDHIQFTKGFTLQHLRFLVLDEADRLLGNAYHSWMKNLMTSAESYQYNTDDLPTAYSYGSDDYQLAGLEERSSKRVRLSSEMGRLFPLQRLLFSATMSEEPAALALMGVKDPIFIKVGEEKASSSQDDMPEVATEVEDEWQESYSIPKTLTERFVMADTATRPILLSNLLLNAYRHEDCLRLGIGMEVGEGNCSEHVNACLEGGSICLIFVSSVETSHRLSSVLQILNGQTEQGKVLKKHVRKLYEDFGVTPNKRLLFGGRVEEMSRLVNSARRESIVQDAIDGKVAVIVCSDRMARGIDLPSVKIVLNFDVAKNVKTYVHRAGRTARANRTGLCISLLKRGQSSLFKTMRLQANRGQSKKFPVKQLAHNTDYEGYLKKVVIDALQA